MTSITTATPQDSATKTGTVTLRAAEVRKVFDTRRGRHEALKSIDLEIEDGEFLTILGPSGCGKTTLLRILAGFEKPTEGDVILDGTKITNQPPNKRPMAMVFQSYALFPHLSVFDNVAYGLKVEKVPKAEMKERVDVTLSIMDLVGLGDRLPTQLSGGQQQRVALARSVVVRPRVLLFDEPLSNLDARLRDQMRSELRRIQKQLGITSVYVTHDQLEAMAMSDRIVVMSEGHIEQIGSPAEIYRKPATVFVADFIGKANLLNAAVVKETANSMDVDVLGVTSSVNHPGRRDGITIVVRPEDVAVTPHASPNDFDPRIVDGQILVSGWVRHKEYVGAATHLTVELRDQSMLEAVQQHTAASGPDDVPAEGAGVIVGIPQVALRAV